MMRPVRMLVGVVGVGLALLYGTTAGHAQVTVGITSEDATAREANGSTPGETATITLTLSAGRPTATQVPMIANLSTDASAADWSVADSSDAPITVTMGQFTVTIPVNATTATFTAIAVDDQYWEAGRTETVTFSINEAMLSGVNRTDNADHHDVVITVADSDSAPRLTLSADGDAEERTPSETNGYQNTLRLAISETWFSAEHDVMLVRRGRDSFRINDLEFIAPSIATMKVAPGPNPAAAVWTIGIRKKK